MAYIVLVKTAIPNLESKPFGGGLIDCLKNVLKELERCHDNVCKAKGQIVAYVKDSRPTV